MKRINVILKATKTGTTNPEPVMATLKVKLALRANFDFSPEFEAFVAATEVKLTPEKRSKLFYDSLSAPQKILIRSYSGELENDDDLAEVLELLNKHEMVQDAREDRMNVLYFTPNDTLFSQLWAMPRIKAPQAWDISNGSGIVVAVCDTGIDATHPDIAGNIWRNAAGEFGFDFSNNDADPSDYQGHGTHVAGTIAASGNNGNGVIGVAYGAKVMSVKVFPNATNLVCARGIRYAALNGARLINCSWGPIGTGPVPADPTLKAAIDEAFDRGCYCIFAAGRDHFDVSIQFPQNYEKVITVASTNAADQQSSFTPFGSVIDIAAPGENILSLQMGGGYQRMMGTSMAAPHVAGAAALILSLATHLSFKNLRYFLQKSGDPISTPQPISGLRLNCHRLVAPAVQTAHRQSTVYTNVGRYALHTSGHIAHIVYGGTGWVQSLIPVHGSPIRPGTFCNMANDRVAAVNVAGNMVNTYPQNGVNHYALIPETFGIVPGTLRYAPLRDAYFATNVFHDFVHIKWVNNHWNMDIVPSIAPKPLCAASVELALAPERPMAINGSGEMVHLWPDPNGTLLCDGSKLSYGYLQTSSLMC